MTEGLDRRTYLSRFGAVAATVTLAGCSGGDGNGDGGGDGTGGDGGGGGSDATTATPTGTAEPEPGTTVSEATEAQTTGVDDPGARVDDYLSDVDNYDGTIRDMTGRDEVVVAVGASGNGGNFAFDPPAVRVDAGTTVVWEWTGQGGAHNVVGESGFSSGDPVSEAGTTYERTFDEPGAVLYYCAPHEALGMKGAILVEPGGVGGTETPEGTPTPTEEGEGTEGTPTGSPTDTDTATPAETTSGATPEQRLDDWVSDAGNYDGTIRDMTGRDEVVVAVGASGNGGNFAFDPPAVRVDAGTTVVWEWTGQGGAHNVVAADGEFESGSPVGEAGHTFELTVDEPGAVLYYCEPHRALGMLGGLLVE